MRLAGRVVLTAPVASAARVSIAQLDFGFAGRFFCTVIIATAAIMITDATSVRGPMGSSKRSQPRNTATTGFTYAYVATRAGVLCFMSQTKVEKPISDPAMIR